MPVEITMPQLSDTMTEGTVVKWHKKEGDKVRSGEEIVDVETDKATMPFEASESGTLAHIAVREGEKVPVGALIAVIATAKENAADVKKGVGGPQKAAPAPAAAAPTSNAGQGRGGASTSRPVPAGSKAAAAQGSPGSGRVPPPAPDSGSVATLEGASMGEVHEPDEVGHGATREAATAVPALPGSHPGQGNGSGGGNGNRVFASPLARRVAADKGVDLGQLSGMGSGPGGRIVQRDVLEFAGRAPAASDAKAPAPAASLPQRVASGEKQVIPMTRMRAAIAAALQRSKQQIPHFYETVDVDVEALSGLRAKLNERLKAENVRLSLADFINKGVCAALAAHPAVNATFDEKKNEITRHGDVNLGIAVAIPDGLIVPVLRSANQMGLKELRQRSAELIERARAQRLKQDEGGGGTFTVSSLGTFGIREFSAIINPPQVAILAVGAAEKRAVVRGDAVVPRTMMTLTLSADHRVVDGATAAEFLQTLKAMLEEPGMMLV
jgi:pyruvate dehydrogenase E2 component (dihydrolipoamide acetyltransferase)